MYKTNSMQHVSVSTIITINEQFHCITVYFQKNLEPLLLLDKLVFCSFFVVYLDNLFSFDLKALLSCQEIIYQMCLWLVAHV